MTRWLLYGVRGAPWLRRNPLEFDIPGCVNFEKLGGGGFSTVYRAYQPQFERHVAVKILDAQLGSMFRRECKTLGKLGNHPHVVTVFQADITKSGTPYIIMEYLVAGSLADRLNASGPLSWREVLTIGTRLAGVLQSVHEAGILHLDVKPANVLIGPDSEPKLADFGIARLRAALDYTTQTLCFTPCYSAPELFAGTEPTAASDLFSLGATLFALLTGHSPFLRSREEQPNIHVLLGRMLYEPTPELDPGVPEDVRAVVRRAMAVSPQDRFGSAAELGEALRTVQRNHGLTTTPLLVVPIAPAPSAPPSPPRPRRWRAATASVLLALTPVADAVHALASGATCTQANPVQADGVLSFGTVLPKTGAFVYAGPALQAGVQLAIDDVKDAGGIPGIAVQHDPANQLDEGDPSANTVRQSTDTLLAGGVDVIIGPATSASAVKVIDMVTCAGAILFSASNTSPRLSTHPDHDRYFRTAPSDIFRGPILGKLVVADGNSTVVVISRNDAFGKDLGQLTAQAIEDAGGRVLARLTYDPQATNYAREVLQIKSMDPDAIVVIGLNDSAPILRGLIAQGLGPQNKRVYGAGNASYALARLVNPQDPGVLAGMKGVFVEDGDDAFTSRLREANPAEHDLTFGAAAYDAVIITALAAATAGTDAPAAVAAQINGVSKDGVKCTNYVDCLRLIQENQNIDYDGASGPLDFTDPGEPNSAIYVISEIQADGFLKPLRTTAVGLARQR